MVHDTLARLLGVTHVVLTSRGNDAIKQSLRAVKGYYGVASVRIPDQGGWLTYRQFPQKLGLTLTYASTHDAYIYPDKLRKELAEGDVLLYENPGGYFVSMDAKGIASVCREKGVPIIADVSGSIGRPCDADILICSFGKGKLVDLGYGGCIGFHDKRLLNVFKETFEGDLNGLKQKVDGLERRRSFLLEHCARIKEDLEDYEIIHPQHEGIVVCVGFSDDEEKKKITGYCERQGYEYTICPRYIRVQRDAVSIEVKRLTEE